MRSADPYPGARTGDLERIDTAGVNGLRAIEVVVVCDVAGVRAIEGGEVTLLVGPPAVAVGVVEPRLDVPADYIDAISADPG